MIIILFEDVNEKDAVRDNLSAPAPPAAEKNLRIADHLKAFLSRRLHPKRNLPASREGSAKMKRQALKI